MQPLNDVEITLAMLILVGAAAVSDLRSRKIPNRLLLTGLVLGLVLSVVSRGTDGLLASLAGFGLGFALLLPGYLLRFTGAGDLKLFATLGVFTGPGMLLQIFAASVLTGAIFVLLLALRNFFRTRHGDFLQRYKGMLQTLLATGQCTYVPSETSSVVTDSILSQRIPMAPMFALGSVMVLGFSLINP
jgi:prepilin peptidase CpaA